MMEFISQLVSFGEDGKSVRGNTKKSVQISSSQNEEIHNFPQELQ